MTVPKTGKLTIIGRNSRVWRQLCDHSALKNIQICALSYDEVPSHSFERDDIVWILSYSKSEGENRSLLSLLREKGVRRSFYVSTATAVVAKITNCYRYPSVKAQAEADAASLLNAQIVRIGLFYKDEAKLPSGINAVTSADTLAVAMSESAFKRGGVITQLFVPLRRPFESRLEERVYQFYGAALKICGRHPCLLRPLDLLLKLVGFRWYGYVYLANGLCFPKNSEGR